MTPESPLDYKEIKPVNPKVNPEYSWKDWCWSGSWSTNTLATWCEEQAHWKRPWYWERLKGGRRRGKQKMRWLDAITIQWTHWMTHSMTQWRESEWTPGVGDGRGGLVCCSQWGRKESDMTEWLNWLTDAFCKFFSKRCKPFSYSISLSYRGMIKIVLKSYCQEKMNIYFYCQMDYFQPKHFHVFCFVRKLGGGYSGNCSN